MFVYHEHKIEQGMLWKTIVLDAPSEVKSKALVTILHVDKVLRLTDRLMLIEVTPMVNDELGPEIVTLLIDEPARLIVNALDWEPVCQAA